MKDSSTANSSLFSIQFNFSYKNLPATRCHSKLYSRKICSH